MATSDLQIDGAGEGVAPSEQVVVLTTTPGAPTAVVVGQSASALAPGIKRAFDIVASLVGLVVLAPILLIIALAIKLTDPGPVLYRHRRLTRTGRPIRILKFRTMAVRYSTGENFSGKTDSQIFLEMGRPDLADEFLVCHKVRRDPRVTRVGHFLRRNSLDELPQLWNILKGELSLVGPRPIVDAELERYGSGGTRLLSLKPGLTGLWQISGRSDVSYEERVRLDLFYVEHWSLWLDVKIVFRTLEAVFQRRGAY